MNPDLSTSEPGHQFTEAPVRVLIIPGLNDSAPTHWQSWLQTQYQGAVRVKQRQWQEPDLDAWAERVSHVVDKAPPETTWIAVAHSFGCLALSRHLATRTARAEGGIRAALLVAPADPDKFGLMHRVPQHGLGIPSLVVGSDSDPWMPADRAQTWASHWGSRFTNLGNAGHINVESGYGPWPWARYKVDQMIRDQQRERRLDRAHPMELHYAI
jgi:predicted alpha/beta hydrolase family esterase